MKNAKKVLAMVIVLALAISMAIPAMAGSITINQAAPYADPATYEAWKMAELTWVAVTGTDGAYTYTAAEGWANFFKNSVYFVYNEANGVVTFNEEDYDITDLETAKAIAAAAKTYVDTYATTYPEAAALTKLTADSTAAGKVVFNGTTKGYYLVYSPLGSALMVNTAGDGDDDMVITEKNEKPVLTKTVKDEDADYAKSVDVAIGDTVTYKLEIQVKPGALNYVVKDTLPQGITYVDNSVSVTGVAGVTVDDSDSNGQNLVFDLDKEELAIGKTIVITYTANVTAGVAIESANANEAVLFYGEDDNDDGIGDNEANRDTANVYTWAFEFAKIANNNFADKLTTATFKVLLDGTALKFSKDGNTYRLLADQDATGTGVYEELSTTDGTYRIEGLDGSLTYTLDEIQVPNGYNEIPDAENIEVTINAEGEVNATSNITDGYVEVNNNSGVELPSTGGTGTVIFIAVGSFLVMAMGVLLVVRKRMSKVVYTR